MKERNSHIVEESKGDHCPSDDDDVFFEAQEELPSSDDPFYQTGQPTQHHVSRILEQAANFK
jgi:hypothetical protein